MFLAVIVIIFAVAVIVRGWEPTIDFLKEGVAVVIAIGLVLFFVAAICNALR